MRHRHAIRSRSAMPGSTAEDAPPTRGTAREGYVRFALIALAGAYLAGVWIDGVGSNLPADILPGPIVYFLQVASLFPRAATVTVDYRAEAWICGEKRWAEIDVRPYFRLDAEHKENRFHRVMHFYRQHRQTMEALELYLVEAHNRGGADDGIPGEPVGGMRFLSVRTPLPAPGEKVAAWTRLPASAYSGDDRHDWYWTPKSRRDERCGQSAE